MTTFGNRSRRHFLASTAIAAAAPFILPSGIWSAEVKPNDRRVLGFIGNGTQGRNLMTGFLNKPETQTVAVCDVDTHRREFARKQVDEFYAKQSPTGSFKGCAAFQDFRELLARKDIDAVVIATPDHWHALIAIAAANAGKDIYCEKPLAQSIQEARAMVNAVRQNQRVFQTGSMQRSSKEFRTACELVRNGVVGSITRVEVGFGGPGKWCDLTDEPVEDGLDWDMWLGPAPKRPYNSVLSPRGVHTHSPMWRLYREYGGGMVTDWGAHHVDIVQWGLGMDHSGPVEIHPASNPDAQSGVKLVYANGVEVSHLEKGGITFYGTDGMVNVDRRRFSMVLHGKQKAETTQDLDAVIREFLTEDTAGATRLYRSDDHKADWLECLTSRKPPITDVEIGARSVSVCHLINFAYFYGQKMKWDPETEEFVDGTGEGKWLEVPHRAPWKIG